MDHTFQDVAVDVIEAKEQLGASLFAITCAYTLRVSLLGPADTTQGAELHGTKLVEAHDMCTRRCLGIESQNAVFLPRTPDLETPSRSSCAGS
jgi:hypothetical protein